MAAAVELIAAPWNLGQAPPAPGREPEAWRGPQALLSAGLEERLCPARTVELDRPPYDFDPQPATRIRNGVPLREHTLRLGEAVRSALAAARFPVVLGGDRSILLGSLLGARRAGRCGLVHLTAHEDVRVSGSSLAAADAMALSLATGHGELLLSHWPEVGTLVSSDEVLQNSDAARLERLGPDRVWLHLDLDVLAANDPAQLTGLIGTGRVVGLDIAVPHPDGVDAARAVDLLTSALSPLASQEAHA
ncbi:arginase family protein [Actinomadura rupiterrae]|uniref:arginase family protein n=1 Tax=Actinomadura rupiterrae TaxID=559627 RepID=UPI0020A473CD|nr:arginase family protein [Actinomadura rupiterrae]MCP2343235.1 arginase [Actinomadura rupiterrae]